MKIFNADGLILGRLATAVAKASLLGEQVVVYNCEKAVISGKPRVTIAKHNQKRERGTHKGPYYYRSPFMFVKRTIQGMVPHKQPRGREALTRIKCFEGEPKEFAGKGQTVEGAAIKKLPNLYFMTVDQLTKEMGRKNV